MITLSCVVFPEQNLQNKISKLAEKISIEVNSHNALKYPPHITLMGDFKIEEKKVDLLRKGLQNITVQKSQINFATTNLGYYPWKIIFLDIKANEKLYKLHFDSIELIKELKSDWIPEKYINTTHFPTAQKDIIDEYGYHFAKQYFSPHFTLAGNDISDNDFESFVEKHSSEIYQLAGKFEKVVLFDRDNNNKIYFETSFMNI